MVERARDLEGRVAIVTGSGRPGGIGEASVRALAEAGARVVACDLPGVPLGDVVDRLKASGLEVAAFEFDVSDEAQVKALIAFTLDTYGRLDVLDNNAAATDLVPAEPDVHTLSYEVMERSIAVDLFGPMLTCKHAIPLFVRQGGGVIVNISSGQSLRGDTHGPVYAAAKAGLNSLTRSVAVMYGKHGVRANAIATGVIQTSLLKQVMPAAMLETVREHVLTPQLGEPIDVAELVVFLASDRARYITGQTFAVDGGILEQVPIVAAVRKLGEGQQHLQRTTTES